MLINAGVDVNLKNKVNDSTPLAEFFSTTSGGRERDLAYTLGVLYFILLYSIPNPTKSSLLIFV